MSQLSVNVLTLLNDQYKHELSNHIKYNQLSSWADSYGLTGIAKFFAKEAKGEYKHSQKISNYVSLRNEKLLATPFMADFEQPQDLLSIFLAVLEIERGTTDSIKNIFNVAFLEQDFQTSTWIQEMIGYQDEEENQAVTIIDRIKLRLGETVFPNQDALEMDSAGAAVHDLDLWIGEL